MTKPQPPPAASNQDAEALLDSANSASQHVAVLHVAFMALCAYVLVIVFGTTDMDLLIGKGVKLPVVAVTVPIVGFYAFAPYLVVLVYFNLLLQLQLLSRKLYAFDAAAPKEERIGGLRDRLHIFPYTYYLVGQPGPIVRWLLGVVVGMTLLLLPLATLLVLQLRFLAYQGQAVTWAQRVAVWFDVGLVIALSEMGKKSELSVEQRTQLMLRMRVTRPPRRALEQESVGSRAPRRAGASSASRRCPARTSSSVAVGTRLSVHWPPLPR